MLAGNAQDGLEGQKLGVTGAASSVAPARLLYWHACETQLLPMHDLQVVPPVPHAELLVPATQLFPMQQPLGQETLSQTQLPPTQCLPVAQAGVLPH